MRRLIFQPLALNDERLILQQSRQLFGTAAARAYAQLLKRAYRLLLENPSRPSARKREELVGSPSFFHLRHARKRGSSPRQPSHFIVFAHDDARVTILRVLHDAMDIDAQLAPMDDS